MAYFNNISIQSADSPSIDAFARWRISTPQTIFDNKQLYDTGSLVWATKIIGNATASFLPNNACVVLTAGSSSSGVIRQSRKRNVYQAGKSQLIVITGNFSGSAANTIKRFGYFDGNNGIYFMTSGSSFGVGLKTNTTGTPTETFISQSSWNLDRCDGTGPSGNVFNLTASQIIFADIEWLGVGRVRYGIFQNGLATYVHQITNVNTQPTVYMSTPNLPIRFEIINSGSIPQSMLHICSTVVSEGGLEQIGQIKAISNTNAFSITNGTYCGLIAIRQKSSSLDCSVVPLSLTTGQTTGTSVYETVLLVNPSGSLNWNWQNLPNSVIQYATSSDTSLAISTDGNKIYSSINSGVTSTSDLFYDANFALGSDVDGNQDVLVLAWKEANGTAANTAASLTWRELT